MALDGGARARKVFFTIVVLAVAGIAWFIVTKAGDKLETSCRITGGFQPSNCTFTNPNEYLSKKTCVRVHVWAQSNPAGPHATSTTVCSGSVSGAETKTVEIGMFEPDVREVCWPVSECDMRIETVER